jgi:hypothetical protein
MEGGFFVNVNVKGGGWRVTGGGSGPDGAGPYRDEDLGLAVGAQFVVVDEEVGGGVVGGDGTGLE